MACRGAAGRCGFDLAIFNELIEHGSSTPTMRAHSATGVSLPALALVLTLRAFVASFSQVCHLDKPGGPHGGLSRLASGGSAFSPASEAGFDEVLLAGRCGQRPGVCECHCLRPSWADREPSCVPYRTLLATSFEYDGDLGLYPHVGFAVHTKVCGIPLAAAALPIALGSSTFYRTTGRY